MRLMRILGQYPRRHSNPIRVNYAQFEIRDRVVIKFDSYVVMAVGCEQGSTILLDRPLERATKYHESIVFNTPRKFENPPGTMGIDYDD